MDAVKFVEESRRMFAFSGGKAKYSIFDMSTGAEDVVKEVEEWAAAHPNKTRQSEFLMQYPETFLDEYGVLLVCPRYISPVYRESDGSCREPEESCRDCRREFWMQEVE